MARSHDWQKGPSCRLGDKCHYAHPLAVTNSDDDKKSRGRSPSVQARRIIRRTWVSDVKRSISFKDAVGYVFVKAEGDIRRNACGKRHKPKPKPKDCMSLGQAGV